MQSIPVLFKEIIGIVLVSAIIGISAQAVLPNGIHLKTDLTMIDSESGETAVPSIILDPNGNGAETGSVTLYQAYITFLEGRALFLDARDQEDYHQGHILGAISLPAHAFMDSLPMLDALSPDQIIITYCDGVDCNASIDLAADLQTMGFTRIFFFFGGWQEWQAAAYPIAKTP